MINQKLINHYIRHSLNKLYVQGCNFYISFTFFPSIHFQDPLILSSGTSGSWKWMDGFSFFCTVNQILILLYSTLQKQKKYFVNYRCCSFQLAGETIHLVSIVCVRACGGLCTCMWYLRLAAAIVLASTHPPSPLEDMQKENEVDTREARAWEEGGLGLRAWEEAIVEVIHCPAEKEEKK